jgi:hypothetical protein
MKLKFRSSMLFLSAGIALALTPAYSTTIITYTNPTTWQAATSAGYQTVTFEGLTPAGTGTTYSSPTGVTASGVEFIGYNSGGVSDIQVFDTSSVSWYNDGTGDALLQERESDAELIFTASVRQHHSPGEYYLDRPGFVDHQFPRNELQHYRSRKHVHGAHIDGKHRGVLGTYLRHPHHFAAVHRAGQYPQ